MIKGACLDHKEFWLGVAGGFLALTARSIAGTGLSRMSLELVIVAMVQNLEISFGSFHRPRHCGN
jgi:hypothetical protein